MVIQRSAGGNTSYFLGHVSAAGSHLYFPLIYVLKESLPVLLMVLLAILIFLKYFFQSVRHGGSFRRLPLFIERNFAATAMFLFVFIYWTNSILSPLNIGLRHLIPTFPFIYILATLAWKKWIMDFNFSGRSMISTMGNLAKTLLSSSVKVSALSILVLWFVAETFYASPNFLSYFNEIGDGKYGGYRFVTDSNYDWGQDLLRLVDWSKQHPEADKIAVDYFGGGNPQYYLPNIAVPWQSSKGNPADSGIHYLAISANTLQGDIQPVAPGFARSPSDEYRWLTQSRPQKAELGAVPMYDARAGTSIFIYKL